MRVPVLPDERERIESGAKAAHLGIAEFLRRAGMGYPVVSAFDRAELAKLSRIHADMGRLGGLLKLWLTEDDKRAGHEVDIRRVLKEIEVLQAMMKDALKKF